jgi:hypothetical protein
MLLLLPTAAQPPTAESPQPLCLDTPTAEPQREPLRHLIMGSPAGVRSAIHQLHVLRYAEQREWSQLLTIPPAGIVLTPNQGEVMSYLIRQRQRQ